MTSPNFSGPRPPMRGRNMPPPGSKNAMRRNERIRAREVRVIGPAGQNLGVMTTQDAIRLARQSELDLIEIAPTAIPPVCKILNWGKFQYEESKKAKDAKQTTTKIKEVKFRVRIETHDYQTKVRHAEAFLFKGNKVKLNLFFRGREMEHKELGFEVVDRALRDLELVGVADSDPRLAGRNITVIISPLAQNKRKLRFNTAEQAEGPEPESDDSEDVDDEADEK